LLPRFRVNRLLNISFSSIVKLPQSIQNSPTKKEKATSMITRREVVRLVGLVQRQRCSPECDLVRMPIKLGAIRSIWKPGSEGRRRASLSAGIAAVGSGRRGKGTDYLGRKCIYLDGGGATLKNCELRDGVTRCGCLRPQRSAVFFGIQFRIASDNVQRGVGLSSPTQIGASRRGAVHAGTEHRTETGRFTADRVSQAQ